MSSVSVSKRLGAVGELTDTLANLIVATGSAGEIGVATDRKALVKYSGAVNGGRIFSASPFAYSGFAECYTASIASATPTLVEFYTCGGPTAEDVILVDTGTSLFSFPPVENASGETLAVLKISGTLVFTPAAATHGAYRAIDLELSTNSGSTWATVQSFVCAPALSTVEPTTVNIQYQAAGITADTATTTTNRYRLMARHDATGTLDVSGFVLFEFGRYS